MNSKRGKPQKRFALKQSIMMLAAAGFSQGLLAGLVPPTLIVESDPNGYHLAQPNPMGYGGSQVSLSFSGAATNGENVNYTVYSSYNSDMSGGNQEWAWPWESSPGVWRLTARPQMSARLVDKATWASTPKKVYYQIEATNPDTGEVTKSNVLDVNYILPPFFITSAGSYLPTGASASARYVPVYVAPGEGKVKLGSVMIYAPDLVAFKSLPPTISGGSTGTISIENGDVYFNASAQFGVGVNLNKSEEFTITYPGIEPVSGIQTGFDTAPISLSVVPVSPGDTTPPQFKLFYNALGNTNTTLNGSPANPVVTFTQNTPEPPEIVKTWQAAKLGLVQVGGQPCPLFAEEWTAVDYMNRTGVPRACLARDPSGMKIDYFSQMTENLSWEQLQWSGSVGLNAHLNPDNLLSGTNSIPVRVDELAPDGTVTRSHNLTYETKFVAPETFTYNLIPGNNIRKIGNYYVVDSASTSIVDYQITSGNVENALRNPTKATLEGENFVSSSVAAYVVDKRDPASYEIWPWDLPAGGSNIPYFIALKEKPAVTVDKRQGGDIKVYINKNEQTLGGYKYTLQRVSSTTGTITVPEDDATFAVGNTDSQWITNDSNDAAHKTTTSYAKVAVVTISKTTLDAVKAAGDFLTIRWEANLANAPAEVRDDPALAADYFSGSLSIDGYSATVGTPEGDLSLPTLLWRGDTGNVISIAGAKNITRVDWTITRIKTGAQIVDSKTNANGYDISTLSAGDYTIAARLANAVGEYTDTPVKSFTIYDRPTATLTVPGIVNRGASAPVSAVTHGVPVTAVAHWEIGGISYPATIDIPNSKITGSFTPDASFPAGKVNAKLVVQVDPNVAQSAVEFVSAGEISVGDLPGGTISTTAKIFWAGKSSKIDFTGNSASKRIDWLVTSPFGQTTTVSKSDLASLDTGSFVEGTYTIVAKVYNEAATPTTLDTPFLAKVYKEPKVSLTAPTAIGAGSSITVKGTYNSLPNEATVKFYIGDQEVPGLIDRGKSSVSAVYTLPNIAPATYPVTLKVLVDPANPDSEVTYTGNPVKALAYSPVKIAITSSPAILDVGVQGIYKATVKASWDTKALPITGNGLMGEWELPDGTIKTGLSMLYTPTEADYELISAGRLPVFRAWLDGTKEATLATTTPVAKMYEPWVMPGYSFMLKRGAPQITAPDSVVLVLTPDRKLDSKMATYRGITYKWTLPAGEGVASQAIRDTLTITANKPGVYPVSVIVADKYGAEKAVTFSFEAIASTFNVKSLTFKGSPESGRVPVMAIPRLTTSSSHTKERPSLYEMIVNGKVVASGSQPKPVTITTEGTYDVGVRVTSNFNSVATRTESFVAAPNQVPVCPKPFRLMFGKIGTLKTVKAISQCKDLDGKIKGYSWSINGQASTSTTDSQSYQFPDGSTSVQIEVTIKDDSGGTFTYGETVTAQ